MGGRREVGIVSHRPVTSSDLKQERSFFLSECLNIFATGCSTTIDKCILEGLVLFDANDVQCCSS